MSECGHAQSGIIPYRSRRLSENGYFPQSLRQAQILILEILNVFLWLKFSPSLILQEISHSRTASYYSIILIGGA